jgi:hypothetical protein
MQQADLARRLKDMAKTAAEWMPPAEEEGDSENA